MFWFVIGIAIIAIIILLLLPDRISTKMTAILSAVGVVFVAYSLWRETTNAQEKTNVQETERNNLYWTDITNSFLTPEFAQQYSDIYGSSLTPSQFVFFTRIAQAIENLDTVYGFTQGRGDPTWITIMRKWVETPQFQIYWDENKQFYNATTDTLIQSLQ